MVRLWQWLTRGRPGGDGRTTRAARRADSRWERDGDRGDQDYYHVPGTGNPDRADPPRLEKVELAKKAETERRRKAGH